MWKLARYRMAAGIATRPLADILADQTGESGVPNETAPAGQLPPELLREWRSRLHGAFGGSLHLRHVDSGSCNACEWELTALMNPVYDMQRLGIDFVASPRHADVLVVTGGLTRNLAEAVRLTYEATAHPKAVLAVGDCACGAGLLGRTYAQSGRVDTCVPVLVSIPGCPPHPHRIIRGLLEVMARLEEA